MITRLNRSRVIDPMEENGAYLFDRKHTSFVLVLASLLSFYLSDRFDRFDHRLS